MPEDFGLMHWCFSRRSKKCSNNIENL